MEKIKVNRNELLAQLESVQAGLSASDILEQSSCVVFRKGFIYTYNQEICCRAKSCLPKDFIGAIPGLKLIDVLKKAAEGSKFAEGSEIDTAEDTVELSLTQAHLVVHTGRRRTAKVRRHKEIQLPFTQVARPEPDAYKPLPEEFCEAVKMVEECCSKNKQQFKFTCLHLHPEYAEACDNLQMCRYKMDLGMDDVLVRRTSMHEVAKLEVNKFCQTNGWVHFKAGTRVSISVASYKDEYPDLSGHVKFEGEATPLPKSLVKASEWAETFSSEIADDNRVLVELEDGWLTATGIGTSGEASQKIKLKYHGPPMAFRLGPKTLAGIAEKHNAAEIGLTRSPAGHELRRLKVNGGKWVFMTVLGKPHTNGEAEYQQADEGGEADES